MSTTQLPDIRAEAEIRSAARFMILWDTDRVEVFSGDRSIGIVTERDVITHVAQGKRCDGCIGDLIKERDRTLLTHT